MTMSPARRWTMIAALLAVIAIAATTVVSLDLPASLDTDEVRYPLAAVAVLAWVGGIILGIAAAVSARRSGSRGGAAAALVVPFVLIALGLIVVFAIWAIANAGLS